MYFSGYRALSGGNHGPARLTHGVLRVHPVSILHRHCGTTALRCVDQLTLHLTLMDKCPQRAAPKCELSTRITSEQFVTLTLAHLLFRQILGKESATRLRERWGQATRSRPEGATD